jgi:hypothetical protein
MNELRRERKIDVRLRPYCRLVSEKCGSYKCCYACPKHRGERKCTGCARITDGVKFCTQGLSAKEYVLLRITGEI